MQRTQKNISTKRNKRKTWGPIPARIFDDSPLKNPLEHFKKYLDGSGDKKISTTMTFVRLMTDLIKDKNIEIGLSQSFQMRREHLEWRHFSGK